MLTHRCGEVKNESVALPDPRPFRGLGISCTHEKGWHMETGLGVLLAMLGGVMAGNCMVPLKYQRRWRWENTWVVFSLVALVLLPWILAFCRVRNLPAVYANTQFGSFVVPFLYGAGWGIAQVLFGLAVVYIGMALSFAITIGLSAALGTLVPILLQHPKVLVSGHGPVLLLGMVLMLAGVFVCSWAGRRREREQQGEAVEAVRRSYAIGVLLAAAAGLLAPMLSYALAFGDSLIREALRFHTASADAPYAVWPIALAGGAVPNLLYAFWLIQRKKSWANFLPVWPEILLGAVMGALWMGSVAIYGSATTLLGVVGASIGWSIYQICIILTANVSGWIAGEWQGISRLSRLALWGGLIMLASATLAITYGNH
jgi:L-rhamnose-H+ transport protein